MPLVRDGQVDRSACQYQCTWYMLTDLRGYPVHDAWRQYTASSTPSNALETKRMLQAARNMMQGRRSHPVEVW